MNPIKKFQRLVDDYGYALRLEQQAERVREQAIRRYMKPDRTKYTITVYKDTTTHAPKAEVEAELAKRIGDNATVIVEGYEEL